MTKTYLPEETSLPKPHSTWRHCISVTLVPSILLVSPKGRIANGGMNKGYSQEHRTTKRLGSGHQIIECLPPQQLLTVSTILQYKYCCRGKIYKSQLDWSRSTYRSQSQQEWQEQVYLKNLEPLPPADGF